MSIPKAAVLVTGLAAAVLVATINPAPAQAWPNKQTDCSNCHGASTPAGTVSAVPSTTTPMAGAGYTVTITVPVNTSGEDTGYWIANSTAAGATGTTTGIYGGGAGTMAASYTATMTAPTAAGTYYYKVWADHGSTGGAATTTGFKVYSITVGAPPTTVPPTTVPPTTVPPTPPVSIAHITKLSPHEGYVGTAVTITGTGFGKAGVVKFGKVIAKVSSWTATKIVVKVPAGIHGEHAYVTATPKGAKASNGVEFSVKSRDRDRDRDRHAVQLGGDLD